MLVRQIKSNQSVVDPVNIFWARTGNIVGKSEKNGLWDCFSFSYNDNVANIPDCSVKAFIQLFYNVIINVSTLNCPCKTTSYIQLPQLGLVLWRKNRWWEYMRAFCTFLAIFSMPYILLPIDCSVYKLIQSFTEGNNFGLLQLESIFRRPGKL